MKKIVLIVVLSCFPLFLFGQDIIEKIEIIGNIRVTKETVLFYISSKEGDLYREDMIKRDLRVLWARGFFSNIRIEKNDGAKGKIVRIIVEENPLIRSITYKTGRKLKEDDIVDKLKEENEYILPYSYYSPYKIQRIKKIIEDLLMEKSLPSGKVKVESNTVGNNEQEIIFDIYEGPKVKVGEVEFVGKPKLLHSVLKEAMGDNRKHGFISWIMGKDVFKQSKLDENLVSIKNKYQEYGYMEATIGEPRIEDITKRSIFLKKQTMKKIIIPVDAGYLYRVGEVKVEGNKIVNTQYLHSLIKFKEGDVYSTKEREKAVEEIQEVYGDIGYLYTQVYPVESLDPKRKRVTVTFNIFEGDVVFLNRLEFKGNTYTKDKVLRREIILREGDTFSLGMFKNSLLRLNQLGLVELEGDPDVKPVPDKPALMNITVNVRELQRNNIQFTAGYSGYEGTFVAFSYSTVNFLGAGEKLELMTQFGKRIKNYMFGFSEPYFLDLPMSLGFNIYNRDMIYLYLFRQISKGIDFNIGARVIGYLRTSLTYSLQNIDIRQLGEDEPYIDPYYGGMGMMGYGKYFISSITPSVYRSTVNSPLTPTNGALYLASCKFAGGILGGDVTLIKPRFEWKLFQPLIRHHVLGFHIEYQFIESSGDSAIPIWERFYLGGERSIRGYTIYSIGPRSYEGRNVGGDKSFVFNAEYIIELGGPLYAILFYDLGNAYAPEQKLNFKDMYTSTGLELRIFVPALRIPFRLIFAYNSRKIRINDTSFAFRFAIGTTF
ncbi:MAG: outer membrane protein assembly factor BamA [Candidatus Aminicenantes bacterium]|nr:outer membrane protein assembly factor BamA [Candidatus Aminicenantes bacterium]MBL7082512.1 outer membrane protein assembly factor BamA [Candidatus Aminicenantes bacterium]